MPTYTQKQADENNVSLYNVYRVVTREAKKEFSRRGKRTNEKFFLELGASPCRDILQKLSWSTSSVESFFNSVEKKEEEVNTTRKPASAHKRFDTLANDAWKKEHGKFLWLPDEVHKELVKIKDQDERREAFNKVLWDPSIDDYEEDYNQEGDVHTIELDLDLFDESQFVKLQEIISPKVDREDRSKLGRFRLGIDKDATVEDLLNVKLSNELDLTIVIQLIDSTRDAGQQWHTELLGRKYPAAVSVSHESNWFFATCRFEFSFNICGYGYETKQEIFREAFFDSVGDPNPRSAGELLEEAGIELRNPDDDYVQVTAAWQKIFNQTGTQVLVGGTVGVLRHSWMRNTYILVPRMHGEGTGYKAIIEPEYEFYEKESGGARNAAIVKEANKISPLPMVRFFSMKYKTYCFADVRDVQVYEYDTSLIDKLVIPEARHKILKSVITADPASIAGDLVSGKHGGMIILAHGPSGTGKTLTAEVFSEYVKKPLYVIEISEIGTKPEELEGSIEKIFERVARWGAIALLDEADIFLAERGLSLERSILVAILLRMLDYHSGALFMTTNLEGVIDPAVKSRITLYLKYEPLRAEARKKVWENLLTAADYSLDHKTVERLSSVDINGRQIRNCVRLLKALGVSDDWPSVREILVESTGVEV